MFSEHLKFSVIKPIFYHLQLPEVFIFWGTNALKLSLFVPQVHKKAHFYSESASGSYLNHKCHYGSRLSIMNPPSEAD